MPFVFAYQKVLDVREKQQRSLEVELGRLERAVLARRADLARWERVRRDVLAQLRSAREGGDMEQNAYGSAYLRHVRLCLEQGRQSLADLAGQRDAVREALTEAVKACKVLQKYRDRLRAEYLIAEEKADERTVELHTVRAHVRTGGTP
jgi:flagellar export protein FliJ